MEFFFIKTFQGLFTWSGGPRFSEVGFFCFHALEDTKQKKPTPLDRDPPLHVNRVSDMRQLNYASHFDSSARASEVQRKLDLLKFVSFFHDKLLSRFKLISSFKNDVMARSTPTLFLAC